MAKKLLNNFQIYLKDSDKVRLADCRARIVREINPTEPCDNEDLVFERVFDKSDIPENAIHSWKFYPQNTYEPIFFFTTPERCKEMISEDPKYWSEAKLLEFEDVERKLYQDWDNGNVYGYVIEKWDEKNRNWVQTSSLWGMYGSEELLMNLATVNIPVCIDSEDMKYDFDNVEMKVNEFA